MWWWVRLAFAQSDTIETGDVIVERATIGSLGVRWPFSGDDDGHVDVTLRFREPGGVWQNALRPHRVRPENVEGLSVERAHAGSVFDLRPDTLYELELTADDPDGAYARRGLSVRTRAVPTDPQNPSPVNVTGTRELADAMSRARPGDVVLLADGIYEGRSGCSAPAPRTVRS